MREMTRPPATEPRPDGQRPDGQPFPELFERVIGRAGRPLGWMWNRGFRFLFVLDGVALFATMVAINLARFGWTWPTYPRSHYWIGFSIATGIHLLINYFAGLYEREPRLGYRPWLPRVAVASLPSSGRRGTILSRGRLRRLRPMQPQLRPPP